MQKKKKPVSWKHRLQTAAGAFFCLLLIPLLLMNSVLIIKGYLHRDQVPGIAGIFPMVILTDSMYPEMASGDLIFCRHTAAEDVRVGDVICFYDPAGNGSTTVTHRVEDSDGRGWQPDVDYQRRCKQYERCTGSTGEKSGRCLSDEAQRTGECSHVPADTEWIPDQCGLSGFTVDAIRSDAKKKGYECAESRAGSTESGKRKQIEERIMVWKKVK